MIDGGFTDGPYALAAALGLEPLPGEGGLYRRTFVGVNCSAIFFMVIGDDFSALHRLPASELYVYQAGAPLDLLLIDNDGPRVLVLGPDPSVGHHLQIEVPPHCWQGSSSLGEWTLVTTVVSPEFKWEMLELGDRKKMIGAYPEAAARITELTRV
ncbi:cupin domain-containing protein [Nakamurella antarctica]|uniref:cupin domain-containing protein n=1 Tax=Nakamurella antarctica TaxID=1902245 RepID=UPI0013DE352B|nr:cupin domain-containing protein [Nakamurella antarctica]